MLLGHNVGVVSGGHTRLDREFVPDFFFFTHVLDTNLVVSAVKGCKVVSDLFFVVCGMNFFAFRIDYGHGQLIASRHDLNDSFFKNKYKLTEPK